MNLFKNKNNISQEEKPEAPVTGKSFLKKTIESIFRKIFIFFRILKYSFWIFITLFLISIYLITSGSEFKIGSSGNKFEANDFENKILNFNYQPKIVIEEREFASFLSYQVNSSSELKNKISDLRVDFKKKKIVIVGIFKKGLLGKDIPFMVSFNLRKESDKINLIPLSFQLGRLPLPSKILNNFWEKLENLLNKNLPPDFLKNIKEIKIEEDKIIFTF